MFLHGIQTIVPPPRGKLPLGKIAGVWVKVMVGFKVMVGNQTIAPEKISLRLALGFGLGSVLGLAGNFPRGKLSQSWIYIIL